MDPASILLSAVILESIVSSAKSAALSVPQLFSCESVEGSAFCTHRTCNFVSCEAKASENITDEMRDVI